MRKNYLKAFCAICLIFAALYLIATADLEYGYYTFIRLLSIIGMPVLMFFWFILLDSDDTFISPVTITLFIILLLFNPAHPIYLDKETWVILDIISAIALLIIGTYVWFKKRNIDD